MPNRMNNETRPVDWMEKAESFVLALWDTHEDGYVFIGTRQADGDRWNEHAFELPVEEGELVDFFQQYPREDYDIYFCANAFGEPKRRTVAALQTRFACVDVDGAPLENFRPKPTIAWETSTGHTQAIWVFNEILSVDHAEQIAKNLAYNFDADRNGWSITKYLRVPFTYNHKPVYDRPEVTLLYAPDDPVDGGLPPPKFLSTRKPKTTARPVSVQKTKVSRKPIATGFKHSQRILNKYRARLALMPRSLLGHKKLMYPDRSAAIYSIVAGLHEAGATRREIQIALWNNVYFIGKYGHDRNRLEEELSRILGKLEGN